MVAAKNTYCLLFLCKSQFNLCVWIFSFFTFRWGCLQYIRDWHGLSWMGIGYALCGKTKIQSVFIGIDAVTYTNRRNKCHKFPKVCTYVHSNSFLSVWKSNNVWFLFLWNFQRKAATIWYWHLIYVPNQSRKLRKKYYNKSNQCRMKIKMKAKQ